MTQRYLYQISPGSLIAGVVFLGLGVVLLGLLGLDGANRSTLWWVLIGSLALCFGLTLFVAIVQMRNGPIEVLLEADGVEVPSGLVGTKRVRIGYDELKGLRIIGRPRLSTRAKGKEGIFLLFGDRYVMLVSDLFQHQADYEACRGNLFRAARAANPDLWVELDGREIGPDEDLDTGLAH